MNKDSLLSILKAIPAEHKGGKNASKSSKEEERHFRIYEIKKGNGSKVEKYNGEGLAVLKRGNSGQVTGSPLSMARKLLLSYAKSTGTPKNKIDIVFTIREITRDSKGKKYGPYSGKFYIYSKKEKEEIQKASKIGIARSAKAIIHKVGANGFDLQSKMAKKMKGGNKPNSESNQIQTQNSQVQILKGKINKVFEPTMTIANFIKLLNNYLTAMQIDSSSNDNKEKLKKEELKKEIKLLIYSLKLFEKQNIEKKTIGELIKSEQKLYKISNNKVNKNKLNKLNSQIIKFLQIMSNPSQ